MPNTTGGPIQVRGTTTADINQALAQIVEILDTLRGFRGQVSVQAPLTLAGGSRADTDAAQMQDVHTKPADPFFWLLRG